MTRPDCAALLARIPAYRCESLRLAAPELHAALAATLEREAVLLRRVEELELMGCSLHKAAAAGRDAERAAVVAWLRARQASHEEGANTNPLPRTVRAAMDISAHVGARAEARVSADAIEAGAHRRGE